MIHLPYPPSVNSLWRNLKGRTVKSKAYRDWQKEAAYALHMHGTETKAPVEGPFCIAITATRPDRRRRDLDNLIKPLLDILCKHGVTEDDHLCQSIEIRWADAQEAPVVEVSI